MANDFSGDSNCLALYNFETGALTTDSKGSNTLTSAGAPAADSVNYKQGSSSVSLDRTTPDNFSITDANLPSDWPGKSGQGNTTWSFCAWIRFTTSTVWHFFVCKSAGAGNRGYYICVDNADKVRVMLSSDGTATANVIHDSVLSTSTWYHVGVMFDTTNGTRIRIHDSSALVGVDMTAAGQALNDSSDAFRISSTSTSFSFGGNIDEEVVFKDRLTTDEVDEIWAGTYGAAVAGGAMTLNTGYWGA